MRIKRLRFAERTPYETVMKAAPAKSEQVLRPQVAAVVRRALIDVVQNGTARRANEAITGLDGKPMLIGGKTGTGDNRHRGFAPGHRLVQSVARSRTATFVFFIGDRFFGTVTAFVEGPEADRYSFTSALPTQLFKVLAPVVQPLVDRKVQWPMVSINELKWGRGLSPASAARGVPSPPAHGLLLSPMPDDGRTEAEPVYGLNPD